MSKRKKTELDIGDVLRAALGNPLDAMVKAVESEPAKESLAEQAKAPTPLVLENLEKVATAAAELQDEIKGLVGEKQKQLNQLKGILKEQMLNHGLKQVTISGRPPIELTESVSRKPTRKGIIEILQKELGEKEGKAKGMSLWNQLEPTTSYSLSIPDPNPPEIESPY